MPVTTRERGLRHHVPVRGGGLDRPSFAMPEYVRSLSQKRFIKRLGVAEPDTVNQVHKWVRWMVSSGFVEFGGDVGAAGSVHDEHRRGGQRDGLDAQR